MIKLIKKWIMKIKTERAFKKKSKKETLLSISK